MSTSFTIAHRRNEKPQSYTDRALRFNDSSSLTALKLDALDD